MTHPAAQMSLSELSKLVDSPLAPASVRYRAGLLLEACQDWPVAGVQPGDLIKLLGAEVGTQLTYAKLVEYANVVRDPWKSSALVAIVELFRDGPSFREDVTFDKLIGEISSSESPNARAAT